MKEDFFERIGVCDRVRDEAERGELPRARHVDERARERKLGVKTRDFELVPQQLVEEDAGRTLVLREVLAVAVTVGVEVVNPSEPNGRQTRTCIQNSRGDVEMRNYGERELEREVLDKAEAEILDDGPRRFGIEVVFGRELDAESLQVSCDLARGHFDRAGGERGEASQVEQERRRLTRPEHVSDAGPALGASGDGPRSNLDVL